MVDEAVKTRADVFAAGAMLTLAKVVVLVIGASVMLGLAGSAAAQEPATLTVWSNTDFAGQSFSYTVISGPEHATDLGVGFDVVGDDAISSMQVADGYNVVLCTDAQGGDTCRMYSSGNYPMLADLDDAVSYLCVHPRVQADVSPCRRYGSSETDHALNQVPALTDQDCRDRFDLRLDANPEIASANPTSYVSRVMVLVHDPLVQRPDSGEVKRLWEWQNWADSDPRVACLHRFYSHVSNGRMVFDVVGSVDVDVWPDNDMLKGWEFASRDNNRPIEPNDKIDEQELNALFGSILVEGRDVCQWIADGDVDEIWIYNAGGFGYFETALAGPDAFAYNWSPLRGIDCGGRTFRIAAASASRGLMVHNFMHGIESTMRSATAVARGLGVNTPWERLGDEDYAFHNFLRSRKEVVNPEYSARPYTGCGNTHFPSTIPTVIGPDGRWTNEYLYGDGGLAGEGAPGWEWTYASICSQIPELSLRGAYGPELVAELQAGAIDINCSTWGCDDFGFYEWWHEHLSVGTGCQQVTAGAQQGLSYDWWRYFASPTDIYDLCPMTTAFDISASCLAENGMVTVTVTNRTDESAPATVQVGALWPQTAEVPAQGEAVFVRTGRPDGDLLILGSIGEENFAREAEVACAPPVPPVGEVDVAVTCVGGRGRIDVRVQNPTQLPRSATVTVGALAPQSLVIEPASVRTATRTGRPDGPIDVIVQGDGEPFPFIQVVTIDCAPDLPVAAVSASCLGDNGRIDVALHNDQAIPVSFKVTVGSLATRYRIVDPDGSSSVTVTGRPDGELGVVVTRSGEVLLDQLVTIACDPIPADEVTVDVSCLGGRGVVRTTIYNLDDTPLEYRVLLGALERVRSLAGGQVTKVTITGRPNGGLELRVTQSARVVASELLFIDC